MHIYACRLVCMLFSEMKNHDIVISWFIDNVRCNVLSLHVEDPSHIGRTGAMYEVGIVPCHEGHTLEIYECISKSKDKRVPQFNFEFLSQDMHYKLRQSTSSMNTKYTFIINMLWAP